MHANNTRRFVLAAVTTAGLAGFALPAAPALAEPGHNGDHAHAEPADKSGQREYVGDPYPLATDPVTGERLGETAVEHVHQKRHLRFNSDANVKAFMKEPAKYLEQVDAKLAEMQRDRYPLKTCPVTGADLGSMGEPKEIIVGNRLVKLCCAGCEGKVEADPKAVTAKLDAAVIEAQSADYKATVCPVSGDKLGGDMGEPVNYVIANRLVKLCCAGCVGMVEANPAKVLAALDGEKADAGRAGHKH